MPPIPKSNSLSSATKTFFNPQTRLGKVSPKLIINPGAIKSGVESVVGKFSSTVENLTFKGNG